MPGSESLVAPSDLIRSFLNIIISKVSLRAVGLELLFGLTEFHLCGDKEKKNNKKLYKRIES